MSTKNARLKSTKGSHRYPALPAQRTLTSHMHTKKLWAAQHEKQSAAGFRHCGKYMNKQLSLTHTALQKVHAHNQWHDSSALYTLTGRQTAAKLRFVSNQHIKQTQTAALPDCKARLLVCIDAIRVHEIIEQLEPMSERHGLSEAAGMTDLIRQHRQVQQQIEEAKQRAAKLQLVADLEKRQAHFESCLSAGRAQLLVVLCLVAATCVILYTKLGLADRVAQHVY